MVSPLSAKSAPWLAAFLAAVVLVAAPAAVASVPQEQRQGAKVLRDLENGDLRCGDASSTDLERVGEYVMGRMLGSTSAHISMNTLMAGMMGSSSEERMHEVMGRRFAGCGAPEWPGGYAGMMGAIGMMGAGGSMMGAGPGFQASPRSGSFFGPGSMMGTTLAADPDEDDDMPAWVVVPMLILFAAAIAAAIAAALRRPKAHASDPIEVLRARYARGELGSEEFEQHLRLLAGRS